MSRNYFSVRHVDFRYLMTIKYDFFTFCVQMFRSVVLCKSILWDLSCLSCIFVMCEILLLVNVFITTIIFCLVITIVLCSSMQLTEYVCRFSIRLYSLLAVYHCFCLLAA
uniref:Uncharacterized protein n=1 Tax=Arundo donax TaxID=35708 RepID=A0A0A9BXP8_ARUDO